MSDELRFRIVRERQHHTGRIRYQIQVRLEAEDGGFNWRSAPLLFGERAVFNNRGMADVALLAFQTRWSRWEVVSL